MAGFFLYKKLIPKKAELVFGKRFLLRYFIQANQSLVLNEFEIQAYFKSHVLLKHSQIINSGKLCEHYG